MHAQVAEEQAHRLRKTDEGRLLIATYRDTIEDRSATAYTSAIGQPFGGWTDGQVFMYSQVHYLIRSGAVRKLTIPVDATPGRDADREGNQVKLTAGLPSEFTAKLYRGNSHDGDALLSWAEGAVMPWIDGHGNETQSVLCDWKSSAPLEIGHTDASRTWLHLVDSGIVARWPYKSSDIWLFFFPSIDAWYDFKFPESLTKAFSSEVAKR